MILEEFSKYLQENKERITSGEVTAVRLLTDWIKEVVYKNPKGHVDRIIHAEIMLAQNPEGDFFIVGKSESGRVLVKALYNFALSYENYLMARWLSDKKSTDFK